MPDQEILKPTKPVLTAMLPAVLEKLAKKKVDKTTKIPPGKYRINQTLTVHIDGFATQQPDSEYTPVELPFKTMLAITLKKLGVKEIPHFITDVATEALKADETMLEELDKAIEQFKSALNQTAEKQTRRGSLRVEAQMTIGMEKATNAA